MKKEQKSSKFFLVSLKVQELFVFPLLLIPLCHIYKLSCLLLRVYTFCTYIHFINFELIFVFVVGYRSTSFFCTWNFRCLSIICRKDCSFPSCSLIKNQLTVGIGVCCCTINSIWLIYMSILMPLWYYFDNYTLAVHFEIEFKSTMFCFFKMILCILGSLKFRMNFKSNLFNFVKKRLF